MAKRVISVFLSVAFINMCAALLRELQHLILNLRKLINRFQHQVLRLARETLPTSPSA